MTAQFALHPQLQADTFKVTDLPLCQVRLMNNASYPWLILVPRVDGATELHGLEPAARSQLMEETALAGQILQQETGAVKINTAAFGNMVPQLHVHVIARFREDPAWPAPVWAKLGPQPWQPGAAADFAGLIAARLAGLSSRAQFAPLAKGD